MEGHLEYDFYQPPFSFNNSNNIRGNNVLWINEAGVIFHEFWEGQKAQVSQTISYCLGIWSCHKNFPMN